MGGARATALAQGLSLVGLVTCQISSHAYPPGRPGAQEKSSVSPSGVKYGKAALYCEFTGSSRWTGGPHGSEGVALVVTHRSEPQVAELRQGERPEPK